MIRSGLRQVARLLAFLLVSPLLLWARLPLSEQSRFTAPAQLLALLPGTGGILIRRVFYERTLTRCGENFTVDWMAVMRTSRSMVGNHCTLGVGSWVGWVEFGDDVVCGPHVVITSGAAQHGFSDLSRPMRVQRGKAVCVKIGSDVWVGAGARILADVDDGTVVGAGAVVVRKPPPRMIVAGVPARVVRPRAAPRMGA
jgi:virginiamycin A acetyltransferase